MKYYLGVDQGGTKTAAVVCGEDGTVLGCGFAGGLVTVYKEDTKGLYIQNIRKAAGDALSQAGLLFEDVAAACGCLNGADWSFEYALLAKNLAQGVSCRDVTVINDCIGALRGGTGARECAVVCAGSGLNIALRRKDGEELIYGYYVPDDIQGATALGKAAVAAAMEDYLGLREPTLLRELVLSQAGYPDMDSFMIASTVGGAPPVPKELARLVLKAYCVGDEAAIGIVTRFAEKAAGYVVCGARRLGLTDSPLEVVCSGSIFKDDGTLIAERIGAEIRRELPGAFLTQARYEPVCGALLTLLDRRFGGAIPQTVLERFDETSLRRGLIRDTRPRPVKARSAAGTGK